MYNETVRVFYIINGGLDMEKTENTLVQKDLSIISDELEKLKKQLLVERQQRKHWQELAMIFHDALWSELRRTNKVSAK